MKQEKQQTAVEWLLSKIPTGVFISAMISDEIIEKAKEMEKQQIMDAYIDGAFRTSIHNNELIDNETIYYLNKYGK